MEGLVLIPPNNSAKSPPVYPNLGPMVGQKQGHIPQKSQLFRRIARRGLDIISYFPQVRNTPFPRIIVLEQLNRNTPWDFFDGASQKLTCGGGECLYLNQNHYSQISLGLGARTNNYAELMTLKLLLCFAIERNCIKLQVFGDSMVIINWLNKTRKCIITTLDALYEEITRSLSFFESILFKHVYRE